MEKLTEVLAMGGYSIYVWPSFIIAFIIMVAMMVISLRAYRQAERTLSELIFAQKKAIARNET